MKTRPAARIRELPPYPFARIDEIRNEARAKGVDLIDLGVGDPDLPTPPLVVEALAKAAHDPAHHRYPSYVGMLAFRQAAARFMEKRFGVKVDPAREALALIGSKEGIAHLPLALVDPGDVVLCPDPGYPVYAVGTRFAGGEPYFMPLRRDRGFLPDLDAIPESVAGRAKVLWVNYPNNPTAAVAGRDFYERVIAFARRHDVVVASDLAYSEVYYTGDPPPSILELPGARDVAIEFHSLSKTFNMTGWRVGFAVGNAALVGALGQVKTNVDSGVFEAVQEAGIAALDHGAEATAGIRKTYAERRDVLADGLRAAGFDVIKPDATFYMLVANPKGMTSVDFASRLLEDAGIVGTPATGFGAGGEGFVRLTLCADKRRLALAVERVKALRL
jgi:LL-diaminopimelate aminotransferase